MRSILSASLVAGWAIGCTGIGTTVTQHHDAARTGANTAESTLTVANVKSGAFGKLFTRDVVGQIYAQPLYAAGIQTNGGAHNVVYVATQQNKVYAFDADWPYQSTPYWVRDFGTPENADLLFGDKHCVAALPWIGITSTPVIVRGGAGQPDRMFVITKHLPLNGTQNDLSFVIHVLNLNDGTSIKDMPISAPGFQPALQFQRAGLVWVPGVAQGGGGVVYAGFGSHCDAGKYHGWILGFDEQLNRVAAFNSTPTGNAGGIWQAGNGIVSDGAGSLYAATGNGTFDGVTNFGSTYLKLAIGPNGSLSLADWFAPYNWNALNTCDVDLASSGPLLLPYQNRLVGGGKEGILYVLDRNNMGHQSGVPDTSWASFGAHPPCTQNNGGGGIDAPPYVWNSQGDKTTAKQAFQAGKFHLHGSPVIWDRPGGLLLYMWTEQDNLVAYQLDNATGLFDPVAQHRSVTASPGDAMPGGILGVSSWGGNDGTGIVWATLPTADAWTPASPVTGTLYAFDGQDITHPIWESDAKPEDALGYFAKFVPPTIANGQVYAASFPSDVATGVGHLVVYGIQCSPACGPGTECIHGSCGAPASSALNACGGTQPLYGAPGVPCEEAGQCGRWTCLGPNANAVTCDTHQGTPNECGGCTPLPISGTGHGKGDVCYCNDPGLTQGWLVCGPAKTLLCCPCNSAPGCGPGAP